MRTSSYDAAELEVRIGGIGSTSVNSGNRALVQNWLVAQGVPSARAKVMKLSTLWKCYNRPRYLSAVLSHIDGNIPESAQSALNAFGVTGDLAESAQLSAGLANDLDNEESGPVPSDPVPTPVPSVPAVANGNAVEMLQRAIRAIAGDAINEARVTELIQEHATRPRVISVQVKRAVDGTTCDLGLSHKQLPLLVQIAQTIGLDGHRLNIWLTGSAGSGKTFAAKMVAQALGLKFAFNGAIDTEYKLLGFVDAQGRIVSRPFREIYEYGGVYLFDEVDSSLPSAVLAFNAALANGVCDFPDGAVERHPDCIIIAAANTYGHGATDQFVGRMKQDAAFLDRFVFLDWQIDEDLERAICPDSAWCETVQAVRRNVARQGLRVIVSPRATFNGAALLRQGLARDTVIALTLRKGISPEQWQSIAA